MKKVTSIEKDTIRLMCKAFATMKVSISVLVSVSVSVSVYLPEKKHKYRHSEYYKIVE